MRLASTLNMDRVCAWRKRFRIMANVEIIIPSSSERVQNPPSYFAVSEGCLNAGFRIPPTKRRLVFSLKRGEAGPPLAAPETVIEVADDDPYELGEDPPPIVPEAEDPHDFHVEELALHEGMVPPPVGVRGKKVGVFFVLRCYVEDIIYLSMKDKFFSLWMKLASSKESLAASQKRREKALPQLGWSESALAASRAEVEELERNLDATDRHLAESINCNEASHRRLHDKTPCKLHIP
ncbi:hypothetical protein KSP39_PZI017639 [Platanthera zijinensis]|uniref:Uncharacterized protein n=1 Tax=Platanthera zijinensis TaxID=2320716 RepID=A0AAP0FZK6_9ASPA